MSLSKIGRYEISGTLGKGAMGVVYKAVDPTIGRTVALKTTRLDVQGEDAEELLARMRNEARLAGVLSHPNIVTVYDAGECDGLFYIAMEYMEGETLHQLMARRKPLPVEQVIELAQQVCAGLDEAAAHRVVHRDVKPANIMIEHDGAAKIMDFGIAKSGGGLTSTGQVLGTPNYMSPEQVRGKPLDGRSDLFSVGVILYEMVTGMRPFTGDNVTTIIYKIINDEPQPPREVNASIHPGLSAVIMKALAKKPDARYQRGAELSRDLMNFKAGSGARSEEPAARLGGSSADNALAAAAAAIAPATEVTEEAAEKPSSSLEKLAAAGKAKVPLWPIALVTVIVLALVVTGILSYVRRSQAEQRTELEHLLAEEKPATPAAAPAPAPAAPASINESSKPLAEKPEESRSSKIKNHARKRAAAAAPSATPKLPTAQVAANPTPAAPAPTVVTGELVLDTTPEGAQVQIDGRGDATWHTPFHPLGILPGPHTVTFTLAGYAGETRVVRVTAGRQAFIAATLKPRSGVVNWNSRPPDAAIMVDGVPSGKSTPAQLNLAEGDHVILLHKSGYSDFSTTVHVKTGKSYNYSAQLPGGESGMARMKKVFGGGDKIAVRVRTTPAGVTIAINGVPQSHASPARLALEPGVYDLTLQLAGYKTVKRTITVEPGTPLEVDETLQKQN